MLLTSSSASSALAPGPGTGAGMMLICSLGCRKLPGRICQNIRMVFLSTHTTFATEDGDLQDSPLALTLSQHVYLYKFPR